MSLLVYRAGTHKGEGRSKGKPLETLYLNLTASNQQHSEHKGSAFLTPAKPHTTTFAKSNLKS